MNEQYEITDYAKYDAYHGTLDDKDELIRKFTNDIIEDVKKRETELNRVIPKVSKYDELRNFANSTSNVTYLHELHNFINILDDNNIPLPKFVSLEYSYPTLGWKTDNNNDIIIHVTKNTIFSYIDDYSHRNYKPFSDTEQQLKNFLSVFDNEVSMSNE